jgi:hypothetical protein
MAMTVNSLFIIANSELQMPRYDTMFLVVSCSITGQFENFSSEVFENSGKVYGSASTTALYHERRHSSQEVKDGLHSLCVVTLFQQTVDTTDGELQTGFGRT